MKRHHFDFIIVGSGIAGLSAAKELCSKGRVAVLTKGDIKSGSTQWAQGGIAAAMTPDDTPKFHLEDTLYAGDGLCDEAMVKILVEEGPSRVQDLISLGAQFDKTGSSFDYTQEGAHSKRRILHAGDATGREIERSLGQHLLKEKNIHFFTHTTITSLSVKNGVCYGCQAVSGNETHYFYAKAVILATGGLGQLYTYNTNPPVATGDGISLAYLAGAVLQDMEFVQFHPTTLYLGDKKPISLFLISEATRGEGGVLRNISGDRFMSEYHPLAELAPRDIVSRAIFSEMKKSHSSHVYLDLTSVNKDLSRRFPTIYNRCLEAKIDISKDFIPVAPAAHYFMGGIKTNEWGQTSITRLYAAGEVASLSLHGANRLASNSLLDGLVFGYRAAQHAGELMSFSSQEMTAIFKYEKETAYTKNNPLSTVLKCRQRCRQLMWDYVGIVRDQKGLEKALREFEILSQSLDRVEKHLLSDETEHMVRLAILITQAALKREESRGAHFRSDFPKKSEK